jgi:exopolyphosphatase/guanosine-5'-triphosphate,3'-diphosphate pyrophosphatase
MKLATMDIGSGTVRALMCESAQPTLRDCVVRRRITRLADGFADGLIQPAALDRTVDAARDLAREARAFGVVEIRAACTGVVRRASNADVFLQALVDRAGLTPVLIDGEFEAQLSARGAASQVGLGDEPFVLLDIGGFSTELAMIQGGRFAGAVSVELGAVALTNKHFRDDPPTSAQLGACAAEARERAREYDRLPELKVFGPLVGTAGTITTLAAVDQKMERYDPSRINRHAMSVGRVRELLNLFVSMPAADRLALPGVEKGREDLMPAGTIICLEVMAHLGSYGLTVTEGGLLQGLALHDEWPPREGRWVP